MERFTCVRIKLISDTEEQQFIRGMIRGHISMICKGYAGANNKLLRSYNLNKPTSYIGYLDANNLNDHSLMQRLPN